MPNSSYDPDARYAALDERVANQGARLAQIEQSMNHGFKQVETTLAALASEFRTNQKPQWQAIGVMATVVIAFMGMIGALAYAPVRSELSDLKAKVDEGTKNAVSSDTFKDFKNTYENNRVAWRIDFEAKLTKIDSDIRALEVRTREDAKDVVPRGEHQERWRSQDAAVSAVQRQIDDLKTALGGIYGARDVIMDLRERLDRTERSLQEINRPPR